MTRLELDAKSCNNFEELKEIVVTLAQIVDGQNLYRTSDKITSLQEEVGGLGMAISKISTKLNNLKIR